MNTETATFKLIFEVCSIVSSGTGRWLEITLLTSKQCNLLLHHQIEKGAISMACKYICLRSPSLTEDRNTLIYQTGHIPDQPQRSGARQLKHRITLTDPQVPYIVFFDSSWNSFPYKAEFFHRLPTTTGCATSLSQKFLTQGRSRPSYRARITQKRDQIIWLQLSTNVQDKTLSWKASPFPKPWEAA